MKKIATAFWSFPSSELSELHFFCKNKKSRTKAYRAIFTLKIAFHPGFPQDNLYFLTNSWTYKLVKLFPNYYLNDTGAMIHLYMTAFKAPLILYPVHCRFPIKGVISSSPWTFSVWGAFPPRVFPQGISRAPLSLRPSPPGR